MSAPWLRRFVSVTFVSFCWDATPIHARDLSFEERVKAQEAIERVYYSHQSGATKQFEEVVPRAILDQKVRTYLKESVALEQFWHTPITPGALKRELERMEASSRLPERLREIYSALGNDSFLVQECVARPVLVSRLLRNFFSSDSRIQSSRRAEAGTLRERLQAGDLDPGAENPQRTIVDLPNERSRLGGARLDVADADRDVRPHVLDIATDGLARFPTGRTAEAIRVGSVSDVVDELDAFVIRVVVTRNSESTRWAVYRVPKITWQEWWVENQASFDEETIQAGADASAGLMTPSSEEPQHRKCVPGDSWDNGILGDLPTGRVRQTAVWTGTVMIVWGGVDDLGLTDTGARYDPATDSWSVTSTAGAPEARHYHSAVWTGSEMIIWGGLKETKDYPYVMSLNTGGRYDPATDTWRPISMLNAPEGRALHTSVWTGREMVIWGGGNSTGYFDTGARYEPSRDLWTPVSMANAPSARTAHVAVWTGRQMIVWGGHGLMTNAGGRYDPETDSWTPTSTANAPEPRAYANVVWTGNRMVVWGGGGGSTSLRSGGLYDPEADSWTSMSMDHVPYRYQYFTVVWTGSRMLAWGGDALYGEAFGEGAAFDPLTNAWSPISNVNAPSVRNGHTAIWTGSLMIIWGGRGSRLTNSGGRYDPSTDTWTSITATHAPMARRGHTAIWTGSRMVIWGGSNSNGTPLDDGGQYDPALDAWTPTSRVNAASARQYHAAVWTGQEMIVWGGSAYSGQYKTTGPRYNPTTDTWVPMSSVGAPSFGAAVWTGTHLVIWDGANRIGARYDPDADTWTAISTANAPSTPAGYTAIWTGRAMIVWGQNYTTSPNAGGRYDPVLDRWTSMSTANGPSPRYGYTAVWDGRELLVWGGTDSLYGYSSTGARYDPVADRWTPMSGINAPSRRWNHTAVWTGKEMVVWGGDNGVFDIQKTGARYDPESDTWKPTSLEQAPPPHSRHTAVWTGRSMIVWGGGGVQYIQQNGGQYYPDSLFEPPVADAGPDLSVECAGPTGTSVSLRGSGLGCGEPLQLSFVWTGPFPEGSGTIHGDSPNVTLLPGVNEVTLTVTDEAGQVATDSVAVTVADHTPPTLTCPAAVTNECTGPSLAQVPVLRGMAVDDCDPRPVVTNSFTPGGPDASGAYPLGTTQVDFTAVDSSGNRISCVVPVTVQDTTPPSLTLAAYPATLWPPNHRMVPVQTAWQVGDVCDPAVESVLALAASSEPDDAPGTGDGNTTGDIQDAEIGTPDTIVRLRAERSGDGLGRVYWLVYVARDASGNTTSAQAILMVPHDEGVGVEPIIVRVEGDGTLGMAHLYWNTVNGAEVYDVIQGGLSEISASNGAIWLGQVHVLAAGQTGSTYSEGAKGAIPAMGNAFFYLVQYREGSKASGWGTESSLWPAEPSSCDVGCPGKPAAASATSPGTHLK